MTEVSPDQLKHAVEYQYGGKATFVQAVPVHETHNGQTVWAGSVHVFDLRHQPEGAFRAYAWFYGQSGGQRQFFTMLHNPRITGPREAVRAAIVAQAMANDRRA
jgi:hypothetical protein